MNVALADGLYRVVKDGPRPFVAGFVVEDGRVVMCAPILRKRIEYWARIAVRVGE